MPRLRLLAAALAAAVALSSAPAAAAAQDSATTAQPSAADSVTAASYASPAAAAATPAQAGPPRTLRAYWHVFIAFTLAWLLVFGYALSLGRRFRKLEKDVEAMGRGSPS